MANFVDRVWRGIGVRWFDGRSAAGGRGHLWDLLFGITYAGEILAFDTQGVPQAVFVDGQSSVETGIDGVNGMAFSNLDMNLWHVSGNRGNDAGHGIEVPVDVSLLTCPVGRVSTLGSRTRAQRLDRDRSEES